MWGLGIRTLCAQITFATASELESWVQARHDAVYTMHFVIVRYGECTDRASRRQLICIPAVAS